MENLVFYSMLSFPFSPEHMFSMKFLKIPSDIGQNYASDSSYNGFHVCILGPASDCWLLEGGQCGQLSLSSFPRTILQVTQVPSVRPSWMHAAVNPASPRGSVCSCPPGSAREREVLLGYLPWATLKPQALFASVSQDSQVRPRTWKRFRGILCPVLWCRGSPLW